MAEEGDSAANQAVHLIFAQASAKPPAELEAFLEQACGGDVELRRHVEDMLAEAGNESDDKGSQAPEQGETIAGYEVIRQIGQGGMGVVYLARDPQLHRQVALKLLQFGSRPHPDAVARFQQEMRAVAHLFHPNIVTAYHASEHDGNQILVMEIPWPAARRSSECRETERLRFDYPQYHLESKPGCCATAHFRPDGCRCR
jgi:hypothetical protein